MGDFLERIRVENEDPENEREKTEKMEKEMKMKVERAIESGDPYAICDVLEKTEGGEYLGALEDAIINTGDIVQIYEFLFMGVDMGIEGFNQERFEQIIRESKNPKLMCYCMGFVPGTNIGKMTESLVETHNTKYLTMLLENEEYEDALKEIRKIYPNYEEIVEESKQYDFFPKSLEEFEDSKDNIEELKEQVKGAKNPHLITELANYIEYLNEFKDGEYDVSDLTAKQEELQDPMQCYEYLASVNVEEKSGLINAVIKSGRAKFMYYVYEYAPDLTDAEKDTLKKGVLSADSNGKYIEYINKADKGEIDR